MTDPNRKDRVGPKAPWPKGKLRNPAPRGWISLRAKLRKMIDADPDRSVDAAQRRSLRAVSTRIADAIGCNWRTVSRWITGERNPTPEQLEEIREWLKA